MKLEVGRDEANLLYFKLSFTPTNARICWLERRWFSMERVWAWVNRQMRQEAMLRLSGEARHY